MSDEAPTRGWSQVPAEVLLFLVTAVAVASFTRLFAADRTVLALLVAAVAAHVVNAAARRGGIGALGTAVLVPACFVLQVSIVLYPHTAWAGLPTPTTMTTVVDDLRRAWDLFRDVQPPVPPERGFVVAATLAIWLAASLADWAGHRLRATAEAVLPAGAIFVFTILLGRGGGDLVIATALAGAVGGFALAQRTALAATDTTWIGDRTSAGVVALARSGALAVVTTALVAGIVVPSIPRVEEGGGVVDWRSGGGPGRTTVSPLVDIRGRLVQQPETVVFEVRSDRPEYWRLTSLDEFDGVVWKSKESFSEADGTLPSQPPDATTRTVEQTYSIRSLGGIWAPAALTPVDLRQSTTELRWNGEMATLIVPTDSINGARYRVVSSVPSFTPDDLGAGLPDPLPADLAAATQLPSGLPSEMYDLAREVTADAPPTPYGQALALQDWFRNTFTYDLEGVNAGHGKNAITAFLEAREGYCEQFAGTFAAMARSLGLPARVAVGFTPGEVDASGSIYTVRGRNAHAWPEVYIPDVGWVPFEPTPGRGRPGAEDYTGVEPAQDTADPIPTTPPTSPSATPPTEPSPPTTTGRSTTVPPGLDLRQDAPPSGPAGDRNDGAPVEIPLIVAAVAAGVLLVDMAGVAVLHALRRRRRHRAAGRPDKVRLAWGDSVASVSRLGLAPTPGETDAEYAARVAGALGPAGPALARLAALATRAAWGPDGRPIDPAMIAEAGHLADVIGEEARRHLTRGQRLRFLIDPRPALQAR